jgi:hypothetical protein
VRRRVLSAPITDRGRSSFGAAAPIELPTAKELNTQAERWASRVLAWGGV